MSLSGWGGHGARVVSAMSENCLVHAMAKGFRSLCMLGRNSRVRYNWIYRRNEMNHICAFVLEIFSSRRIEFYKFVSPRGRCFLFFIKAKRKYYLRETAKMFSCFHFKTSAFLLASSVKRICFTFSRIIVCKSRNENVIVYGYRSDEQPSVLFYGAGRDAARNKGEKKKRFDAMHRAEERSAFTSSYLSDALHQITGQFRASSRASSFLTSSRIIRASERIGKPERSRTIFERFAPSPPRLPVRWARSPRKDESSMGGKKKKKKRVNDIHERLRGCRLPRKRV